MNAPVKHYGIQSTLRKMGNSTGMILPKAILDQLGLACGAKLEIRVENGEVIAKPAKRKVREGWEEGARLVGAEGLTAEELEWLDFDDGVIDDSPIPPEWLGLEP
jgi:antitoxin MazE